MHAFLIVGKGNPKIKIEEIVKRLEATPLTFPLKTIQEVRELSSFTKLKVNEKTAIVVLNIDKASLEAQHAFLKNLEEPQNDLYFILTAVSINSLVETIVSRCEVVKLRYKNEVEDVANNFFKLSLGGKLNYLEKLRLRADAIDFIEALILNIHKKIIAGEGLNENGNIIEKADKTLKALKKNGNVRLQLANFVVSLKP